MKKQKKSKNHFLLVAAAAGLVFLLLMGIFGEWGMLDLYHLQQEKAAIIAANNKISAENQVLARKIDRLKNDRQYVENIVRRELGVVKESELIIQIPPTGQSQKNRSRARAQ